MRVFWPLIDLNPKGVLNAPSHRQNRFFTVWGLYSHRNRPVWTISARDCWYPLTYHLFINSLIQTIPQSWCITLNLLKNSLSLICLHNVYLKCNLKILHWSFFPQHFNVFAPYRVCCILQILTYPYCTFFVMNQFHSTALNLKKRIYTNPQINAHCLVLPSIPNMCCGCSMKNGYISQHSQSTDTQIHRS